MDQKVKYIKRIISAIFSGCIKPRYAIRIVQNSFLATHYCVKILTLPGRK